MEIVNLLTKQDGLEAASTNFILPNFELVVIYLFICLSTTASFVQKSQHGVITSCA